MSQLINKLIDAAGTVVLLSIGGVLVVTVMSPKPPRRRLHPRKFSDGSVVWFDEHGNVPVSRN